MKVVGKAVCTGKSHRVFTITIGRVYDIWESGFLIGGKPVQFIIDDRGDRRHNYEGEFNPNDENLRHGRGKETTKKFILDGKWYHGCLVEGTIKYLDDKLCDRIYFKYIITI